MNPMEAAAAKKQQERETLRGVIAQWNANRLDLFELSEPNEVSLTLCLVTIYRNTTRLDVFEF